MPASPALWLAASALAAALLVAAAIWRVRLAAQAVPAARPQAQTARRFAGAYAAAALLWLGYALLTGLGPFVVQGQVRPDTSRSCASSTSGRTWPCTTNGPRPVSRA